MKRVLSLLFCKQDRLVVVEAADSLGYRIERIPVIPDYPEDVLYLIDKEVTA